MSTQHVSELSCLLVIQAINKRFVGGRGTPPVTIPEIAEAAEVDIDLVLTLVDSFRENGKALAMGSEGPWRLYRFSKPIRSAKNVVKKERKKSS